MIEKEPKVDIAIIDRVIQREFQKPLISWIKGSSHGIKLLLVSLIHEVVGNNNKAVDLSVLFKRLNCTLKQLSLLPLNFSTFISSINRVSSSGVFSLVENEKERSKAILSCETEDLLYGLQDDKFLKEHNQLAFFLNN